MNLESVMAEVSALAAKANAFSKALTDLVAKAALNKAFEEAKAKNKVYVSLGQTGHDDYKSDPGR